MNGFFIWRKNNDLLSQYLDFSGFGDPQTSKSVTLS